MCVCVCVCVLCIVYVGMLPGTTHLRTTTAGSKGGVAAASGSNMSCCAQTYFQQDSEFCDCRAGLAPTGELIDDHHGACWESCMDCFGDAAGMNDTDASDCVSTAFPPEEQVEFRDRLGWLSATRKSSNFGWQIMANPLLRSSHESVKQRKG